MSKTEYLSFDVALRIREVAKKNDIVLRQMFEDIGLSKGTMDNLRTSMPKADNLARIADYLDVSMDYLMGRTDEPNIKNNSNVITIRSGKASHIGDINNIKLSKASSEDISEIAEMIKELSLVQRSEIVLMIDKMKKQEI
ncbi:MAG: helix-turn-helix transcriptional regulator [Muribaculaceae bacterium]|nr:helix-turn-helix transcriptional regulator [Alistipes senegalensis]MCM1474318.1 helix-turn-helix transcriptional regulator [Muribaculaceae bacterium]